MVTALYACAPLTAAIDGDHLKAIEAAIGHLSDSADIDQHQIQIISYKQVYWSNSCLDFAQPDELCLPVITPGWQIVLSSGGDQFEFHTDKSGKHIRQKHIDLPKASYIAVLSAMNGLSVSLGIDIDQIEIVSYMQVNWSDACLGLAKPGEMCLKMITPGWLIILRASGETYKFHTDKNGNQVRPSRLFGIIG